MLSALAAAPATIAAPARILRASSSEELLGLPFPFFSVEVDPPLISDCSLLLSSRVWAMRSSRLGERNSLP